MNRIELLILKIVKFLRSAIIVLSFNLIWILLVSSIVLLFKKDVTTALMYITMALISTLINDKI